MAAFFAGFLAAFFAIFILLVELIFPTTQVSLTHLTAQEPYRPEPTVMSMCFHLFV